MFEESQKTQYVILLAHHCIWDGSSSNLFKHQLKQIIYGRSKLDEEKSYAKYCDDIYKRAEGYTLTRQEIQGFEQCMEFGDFEEGQNVLRVAEKRSLTSLRIPLLRQQSESILSAPLAFAMKLLLSSIYDDTRKCPSSYLFFVLHHNRRSDNKDLLGLALDLQLARFDVSTGAIEIVGNCGDIPFAEKMNIWSNESLFDPLKVIPVVNYQGILRTSDITSVKKADSVEIRTMKDARKGYGLSIEFDIRNCVFEGAIAGPIVTENAIKRSLRWTMDGMSEKK